MVGGGGVGGDCNPQFERRWFILNISLQKIEFITVSPFASDVNKKSNERGGVLFKDLFLSPVLLLSPGGLYHAEVLSELILLWGVICGLLFWMRPIKSDVCVYAVLSPPHEYSGYYMCSNYP